MRELDLLLFRWLAGGNDADAMVVAAALLLNAAANWAVGGMVLALLILRPRDRMAVAGALLLAMLGGQLAHGIAGSLAVPRPFALGLGANHLGHGFRGGMPSTHATVLFTLAMAMQRQPSLRMAGRLAAALALVVVAARVYLGAHFVGDVAAGALLAFALVQVAARPAGLCCLRPALAAVRHRLLDPRQPAGQPWPLLGPALREPFMSVRVMERRVD